jgi:hypothetical protein
VPVLVVTDLVHYCGFNKYFYICEQVSLFHCKSNDNPTAKQMYRILSAMQCLVELYSEKPVSFLVVLPARMAIKK